MKTLKPTERKMFKQIVQLSQKSLLKTMKNFLEKKYPTVYSTKEYIYAIGSIPVTLVAHLDTVFPKPPSTIYCDESKGVLWSPQGLGADDRAGVFSIIQLVKAGLRPSIILTTDEEQGGIGASAFVEKFPEPMTITSYLIQLDRRGTNDCVFYDCDNPDFTNYIEDFGFIESFGSFSDISIICPQWKIAGVNLSIGYEDEHSFSETLHMNAMLSTISKVIKMLSLSDIPAFEYIPNKTAYYFSDNPYFDLIGDWYGYSDPTSDTIRCAKCNQVILDKELIPVKLLNGSTGFYCPECIASVGWCEVCQEAFELGPNSHPRRCNDCMKQYGGSKWPKFSMK